VTLCEPLLLMPVTGRENNSRSCLDFQENNLRGFIHSDPAAGQLNATASQAGDAQSRSVSQTVVTSYVYSH